MDNLSISLRQRKLLHFIQHQNCLVTGQTLANHLHVSARTIRNDIADLNIALNGLGIKIASKRSRGYYLDAKNEATLKKLNQSSDSFLFREDRVRHIVFRLCLSRNPILLYDLEDEMYISKTTLEHDLIELRKLYILHSPYIELHRSQNRISFSTNERKRRAVLNRLFSENWNYNARGNAYYNYQFLKEDTVNLIMEEVKYHINKHGIIMEDVNMVCLNLSISIMYYRIKNGFELTDSSVESMSDSIAKHATTHLIDSLEKKLSCSVSIIERKEIYLLISCSRLLNSENLNFGNANKHFEPAIIRLADSYIHKIYNTFYMDFSDNEDFYITLLQYLRYLSLPVHFLNDIDMRTDSTRTNLLIALEIAYLFQPYAIEYYKHYLDYTELMYLAFCISGALAYANRTSPKLNTVIMSHLNSSCSWNIKHSVLSKFKDYVDLKALLPVYLKDSYDFSNIDLVLTTANKQITDIPTCKTIVISPFFTAEDQENLDTYILSNQIRRYNSSSLPKIYTLFKKAFWHENIVENNKINILQLLADDFISRDYVSEDYLSSLLQRESILTFAFQPNIILTYSLVESQKTCLSIVSLKNRIKWHNHKIQIVIMAALRPEDTTLILQLCNLLYLKNDSLSENTISIRTKTELLNCLALDNH